MTEGQTMEGERKQFFAIGSALPGPLPPAISCTRIGKGAMCKKPNQDNFSLTYFKNGYAMACCTDGHGDYGHLASTRIVQTVPYYLFRSEHFPHDMDKALIAAFESAHKELVAFSLQHRWSSQLSGSTAIAAVWKGNKIWTANCGDCRCVIGYELTDRMVFETKDHKPTSPGERKRIEGSGGEVRSETFSDGFTTQRVY